MLSCKYHGWWYGLKGNLAKAPRFETVPEFDKDQNGLLPVHVHIDKVGFVWVNLQAGEADIKWENEFHKVDEQPRMQDFDYTEDYEFDHYWKMDLGANWKVVIENYTNVITAQHLTRASVQYLICLDTGSSRQPGIWSITSTIKSKDKPISSEPLHISLQRHQLQSLK
ncbi:hypothetical protein EIK77_009826 [Talaromyces pinophilus]|nr:hypothetical protein EIK77_009826 [Talaromyces pinophilus]